MENIMEYCWKIWGVQKFQSGMSDFLHKPLDKILNVYISLKKINV